MPCIILLNKPFNTLSQFTDASGRDTLKLCLPDNPGFHAAGRLDYDSEGLLLLTDNGPLQHQITHPKFKLEKTYYAQIEGSISEQALQQLRSGVELNDGMTLPAKARRLSDNVEQILWQRTPPIRQRKNIPTSWIELKISEGRNRQVRRMTAAVGHPTLRLVRMAIGPWRVDGLQPGEHRHEQIESGDKRLAPATSLAKKSSNTATPSHGRRKIAGTEKRQHRGGGSRENHKSQSHKQKLGRRTTS